MFIKYNPQSSQMDGFYRTYICRWTKMNQELLDQDHEGYNKGKCLKVMRKQYFIIEIREAIYVPMM